MNDRPPDAVMMPVAWGDGLDDDAYTRRVCDYARFLLGGRPYVRAPMPGSRERMLFATTNPHDTMFHEYGHARQLKPRYMWEDRPDGSRVGWLTDDATRWTGGVKRMKV